jgi:hypothetical protein
MGPYRWHDASSLLATNGFEGERACYVVKRVLLHSIGTEVTSDGKRQIPPPSGGETVQPCAFPQDRKP